MTRRLLAFFASGLLMALVSCSPKHSPLDPPSITISNNGCIANCWNRSMNDVCKKLMDECGNRLLAAMETERKREEAEIIADYKQREPHSRTASDGTMDITPDGAGSEWTILRQTDGRTRLLKKQGKSLAELKPLPPLPNPEYDPQTGGFPKESNIRFEHTPPSQAFPRSNPRPRNGECPVCGTMAEKYDVPIGPYSWRIESRRIDCAHCNTTFRQWAKGKEPKR